MTNRPPSIPLTITARVKVPTNELRFTFSRAAGPGGQNVNKVNTRVTLHFDIYASDALSDAERRTLRRRLATRVSRLGILHVVASKHRTQAANRRAAVERFVDLLSEALTPPKPRRPTSVPRAARRRRLEAKTLRSEVKSLRRRPASDGS